MDDRLQKSFALLFSDNPGEQANAARTLVTLCAKAGVGPSDVRLVHTKELNGQLYSQMRRLQADNEALLDQVAFLRGRAPEGVPVGEALKWSENKTVKIDRWPEFRGLASRRLFKGSWPGERVLFRMLASDLGVSPDTIRRWREGLEEIPQSVFDQLQARTLVEKRKAAVKKAVLTKQIAFGGQMIPETNYRLLQALLNVPNGAHHSELSEVAKVHPKTTSRVLGELRRMQLAEPAGLPGSWRPTKQALQFAADAAKQVA